MISPFISTMKLDIIYKAIAEGSAYTRPITDEDFWEWQ